MRTLNEPPAFSNHGLIPASYVLARRMHWPAHAPRRTCKANASTGRRALTPARVVPAEGSHQSEEVGGPHSGADTHIFPPQFRNTDVSVNPAAAGDWYCGYDVIPVYED